MTRRVDSNPLERGRSVVSGSPFLVRAAALVAMACVVWPASETAGQGRPLQLDDYYRFRSADSPALSPDGSRVLTTSSDKTARLWPVDADQLLERADRLCIRDFTPEERERYGDLLGDYDDR